MSTFHEIYRMLIEIWLEFWLPVVSGGMLVAFSYEYITLR